MLNPFIQNVFSLNDFRRQNETLSQQSVSDLSMHIEIFQWLALDRTQREAYEKTYQSMGLTRKDMWDTWSLFDPATFSDQQKQTIRELWVESSFEEQCDLANLWLGLKKSHGRQGWLHFIDFPLDQELDLEVTHGRSTWLRTLCFFLPVQTCWLKKSTGILMIMENLFQHR